MPVTRSGGRLVGYAEPLGAPDTGFANGSPKQRGKDAAGEAAEQTRQVASIASGQGREVAGVAKEQVGAVTSTVKEQATQLTQELSDQGRALYEEARGQLERQAETQTQNLAEALHRRATQTQALANGHPEQAGAVGQYAQQLADRLQDVAAGIENRGVSGLVEETQDFARRRPGAFIFGAVVVGFAGGRLVRSSSSDDSASTEDSVERPSDRRVVPSARQRAAVGTGRRRNPPSLGGE